MELKGFPLAWRWMDEKYAVLPEHVLSRIVPQTKEQAALLFKRSQEFCGADGLDHNRYSITQLSTRSVEPQEASSWLLARHQNTETTVLLSWEPTTAVSTTWGIFVQYWSEFCYPASDDLNVWSESETWALLYHHEEFLQFGERI